MEDGSKNISGANVENAGLDCRMQYGSEEYR
jgi:hypothetical protein